MKNILVIHGPNLNLLGMREPAIYGKLTLAELNAGLIAAALEAGMHLVCFQTNNEAEFITAIHNAIDLNIHYLILNAAAFTHTSIAIRDALLAVAIPFIEVHMSNIYQRESFRQQSYLVDIAQGIISGFGVNSYFLAVQAIIKYDN